MRPVAPCLPRRTPVFPSGVRALGLTAVGFAPTIAGAAPTVAEITKTVSCDFVGAVMFGGDQSKGRPAARLCSTISYEALGRFEPTMDDLMYLVNPQTPTDTNYQAYLTFTAGLSGFLILRAGLNAQTVDWTAGQKVDYAPVTFGTRRKVLTDPEDEYGEFHVIQAVAITGAIQEDKTVLA
jgi:hypothetical protein